MGYIQQLTGSMALTQTTSWKCEEPVRNYLNSIDYIPGGELVIRYVDGGSDMAKCLAGWKYLVETDPKPIVMSIALNSFALAQKDAQIREKVPMIADGYDPGFSALPSWTFSANGVYVSYVGAWADYYLKELWPQRGKTGSPKFCFLTMDVAAARACISDEVIAYLKSKGIEVLAPEFISMATLDPTPNLLRMKEEGVDFCFGITYTELAVPLVKAMDKLGMTIGPKGTFDMCYTLVDVAKLAKTAGAQANGFYTILSIPTTIDQITNPGLAQVLEGAGLGESVMWSGFVAQPMIIAAECAKRAAKEVGVSNVTGEEIYKQLTKLNQFDPWISSAISFSETKRFGEDTVYLYVAMDGKGQLVANLPLPELVPGGKDVPSVK
jgi:hypothetical protein